MRSILLSAVLGLSSVGLVAVPSTVQARPTHGGYHAYRGRAHWYGGRYWHGAQWRYRGWFGGGPYVYPYYNSYYFSYPVITPAPTYTINPTTGLPVYPN